jgi:cytidylate kinase
MEGRDIGTVVFPCAEKKFYLDASSEIRAQRRFRELQEEGITLTFEQVIQHIKDRDHKDKTRSCGPLKKADDAIYIDSSSHTIEGVVALMLSAYDYEKKQ